MSRKSKQKAEQSNKRKASSKEPWEQSIYDTESTPTVSRSQQHQKKRGNTVFMTWLVILLSLCVLVPLAVGLYLLNESNNDKATASSTSSSSIVASKESTTASSTTESSSSAADTTADENADQNTDQNADAGTDTDTNTDDGTTTDEGTDGVDYGTVQAGEGPYSFATRYGISLDTLYSLNGINANTMLQPGQQLKIK